MDDTCAFHASKSLALGDSFFVDEEYEEALDAYAIGLTLINTIPGKGNNNGDESLQFRAHLKKAATLIQLNREKEALKELQHGLTLTCASLQCSEIEVSYYRQGQSLLTLKRFSEAKVAFEKSIRLANKNRRSTMKKYIQLTHECKKNISLENGRTFDGENEETNEALIEDFETHHNNDKKSTFPSNEGKWLGVNAIQKRAASFSTRLQNSNFQASSFLNSSKRETNLLGTRSNLPRFHVPDFLDIPKNFRKLSIIASNYEEIDNASKKYTVESSLILGDSNFVNEEYEEALKAYVISLHLISRLPGKEKSNIDKAVQFCAHLHKATTLMRLSHYNEALQELQGAFDLKYIISHTSKDDSATEIAHYRQGQTLMELKRFSEAKVPFNKAIQLAKKNQRYTQKRYHQLVEQCEEIIRLENENSFYQKQIKLKNAQKKNMEVEINKNSFEEIDDQKVVSVSDSGYQNQLGEVCAEQRSKKENLKHNTLAREITLDQEKSNMIEMGKEYMEVNNNQALRNKVHLFQGQWLGLNKKIPASKSRQLIQNIGKNMALQREKSLDEKEKTEVVLKQPIGTEDKNARTNNTSTLSGNQFDMNGLGATGKQQQWIQKIRKKIGSEMEIPFHREKEIKGDNLEDFPVEQRDVYDRSIGKPQEQSIGASMVQKKAGLFTSKVQNSKLQVSNFLKNLPRHDKKTAIDCTDNGKVKNSCERGNIKLSLASEVSIGPLNKHYDEEILINAINTSTKMPINRTNYDERQCSCEAGPSGSSSDVHITLINDNNAVEKDVCAMNSMKSLTAFNEKTASSNKNGMISSINKHTHKSFSTFDGEKDPINRNEADVNKTHDIGSSQTLDNTNKSVNDSNSIEINGTGKVYAVESSLTNDSNSRPINGNNSEKKMETGKVLAIESSPALENKMIPINRSNSKEIDDPTNIQITESLLALDNGNKSINRSEAVVDDRTKSHTVESSLALGDSFFVNEYYEKALHAYDTSLALIIPLSEESDFNINRKKRNKFLVHFRKATILFKLDRHSEALNLLQQAVALNCIDLPLSEIEASHYRHGQILMELERFSEAKIMLDKAVQLGNQSQFGKVEKYERLIQRCTESILLRRDKSSDGEVESPKGEIQRIRIGDDEESLVEDFDERGQIARQYHNAANFQEFTTSLEEDDESDDRLDEVTSENELKAQRRESMIRRKLISDSAPTISSSASSHLTRNHKYKAVKSKNIIMELLGVSAAPPPTFDTLNQASYAPVHQTYRSYSGAPADPLCPAALAPFSYPNSSVPPAYPANAAPIPAAPTNNLLPPIPNTTASEAAVGQLLSPGFSATSAPVNSTFPVQAIDDPFAPKPPTKDEMHSAILGLYEAPASAPVTQPVTPAGLAVPQPNFGTPVNADIPNLIINAALPITNEETASLNPFVEALQHLVNIDDISAPVTNISKLSMADPEQEKKKKINEKKGKSTAIPPVASGMVGGNATLSQINAVKSEKPLLDPADIMKPLPQNTFKDVAESFFC